MVHRSIQDRSSADTHTKVVTPLAVYRSEIKQKQNGLKQLREISASGLGLLMDEGLTFDIDDNSSVVKGQSTPSKEEWMTTIAKSISLMETVLRKVPTVDIPISEFEESVFTAVEDDAEVVQRTESNSSAEQPMHLAGRLQHILKVHLPEQAISSKKLVTKYGRPSRLTRYWIPAVVFLLTGSTALRVIASRRAEITTWIREFGATVIDFWANWVVEPIKKLIGTIRHDENSEVAIMSKSSLEGDRASLERMVVDFAIDHPEPAGTTLSEAQKSAVRLKVKEGDLTPVLRAYERDLQRPFMGTIRGDLIRAMLIQIQKTKVDVEVAIGGIDALLKSQELVFGYVH